MIPTMVQIADDELFSTWMFEVMQMNGGKATVDQHNFLRSISYELPMHGHHSIDFLHTMYVSSIENICLAEKDDPIFPKIEDILRKHTDIYAMMPFRSMGDTAKRMEYCLHENTRFPRLFGSYGKEKQIKICPKCAKEDEAMYGRRIIHVQHQLCVDTCWKHGCVLQYADTGLPVKDKATPQDMEKATLMHELFETPIVSHFWMLRPVIMDTFANKGILWKDAFIKTAEDGYITKEQANNPALCYYTACAGNNFSAGFIGATVKIFHDRENLSKALGTWDPLTEYTYNDFEVLSSEGILTKFKCRKCGHVFYMNPVAAEYGIPCPKCIGKMSKTEVYQRLADRLNDGGFDISEDHDKMHIIHKACGKDVSNTFIGSVWNHSKCSHCYRNHLQNMHIGECLENADGRTIEIIGWENAMHVHIRFSDGETTIRPYAIFKQAKIDTTRERKSKG